MNILGLIVEYNPFHNGHLYHLQQSVKKTKANLVVAVMSGPFLQRGEPAFVDKWARTRMALQGGADIVLELPYVYATQKAEIFANGAVSILDAFHVTDICFGSESGEIEPFIKAEEWIRNHKSTLDPIIKKHMYTGKSYPRAFSEAYQSINHKQMLDLSQPNNILGFHYVQSVYRQNPGMKVHTIKRRGANYHDQHITSERIASATAIRYALLTEKKQLDDISCFVPSYTLNELMNHHTKHNSFYHWEDYFRFLQYKIISEDATTLQNIYECEEGLEHRLKKTMIQASSFEEFIQTLKTKRYTRTRLQRLLVHIYLNTTKPFMKQAHALHSLPYIRVLGMSLNGREWLSNNKKQISVPIITNASQSHNTTFQKDLAANRLYELPNHLTGKSFTDEYKKIPIQYDYKKDEFLR